MTMPWEAVEDYFLSPASKTCYTLPLEAPMRVNSPKPILEIKEVPLAPWN